MQDRAQFRALEAVGVQFVKVLSADFNLGAADCAYPQEIVQNAGVIDFHFAHVFKFHSHGYSVTEIVCKILPKRISVIDGLLKLLLQAMSRWPELDKVANVQST